jgi:hypothetical protein
MSKKIAVLSDFHCGHRVGLTPTGWLPEKDENGEIPLWAQINKAHWTWYAREIARNGPYDIIFVNGDLVDGKGKKSGATELLAPDMEDQADMAVKIIRQIPKTKNCKILITRGTPFHVSSSDGEDWENVIAERVGATISDQLWIEVEGIVFDLKHHPAGGGGLPHTRHTGVAKDHLWNSLLSQSGEQPNSNVILRCLSEDTEILTDNGWKTKDTISGKDLALTLSLDRDKLEWNVINAITVQSSDKEMVHVRAKGYESLVTNDHTMIFRPSGVKGKWQKTQAEDLIHRKLFQVPVSGFLDRKGVDLSDAMIELLAWVIAEGNMDAGNASKGNAEKNNVRLFQRVSKAGIVEDVLIRAGVPYTKNIRKSDMNRPIETHNGKTYYTKEDIVVFYIRQPIGKKIIEMLNGEKNIPNWLMDMNAHQFNVFLKAYVLGDGHIEGRCVNRLCGKIFTANKDLADKLQILLITNGYKSYVSPREKWGKTTYIVGFSEKQYIRIQRPKHRKSYSVLVDKVEYTGETWCVSTNNGTLVTRRNGRVAIVGNSHVHYHNFCGGHDWIAMTTPALQGAGSKFGARRCVGKVDFGFLTFTVDKGSFSWKQHIAKLVEQKSPLLKL